MLRAAWRSSRDRAQEALAFSRRDLLHHAPCNPTGPHLHLHHHQSLTRTSTATESTPSLLRCLTTRSSAITPSFATRACRLPVSSSTASANGASSLPCLQVVLRRATSGMALSVTSAASHAAAAAAGGRASGRVSWSWQQAVAGSKHYGRCYYELSKTRLSLLVVATAAAGYAMGSGENIDWAGMGWTSLGTFLAAASANTWNQVYEASNDSLMRRTRRRPLPAGRMGVAHAVAWALATGGMGVAILASKTDPLTASLGAANIGLYALVYTPMKQIHVANTWVGAVVGAIPPLMGWSAASSGHLSPGSFLLAGALYFWQLPHFMALAWMGRRDYAAGGYRMLSLCDPSGRRTAAAALRNAAYLMPLGAAAVAVGCTSMPFLYENVILTGGYMAAAVPFLQTPSSSSARHLFRVSLLYLPALMAAMLVHRVPQTHKQQQEQNSYNYSQQDSQLHRRDYVTGLGYGDDDEDRVTACLVSTPRMKEEHVWVAEGERRRGLLPIEPRQNTLPPVAYYSAAPFPFLPVPHYTPQ